MTCRRAWSSGVPQCHIILMSTRRAPHLDGEEEGLYALFVWQVVSSRPVRRVLKWITNQPFNLRSQSYKMCTCYIFCIVLFGLNVSRRRNLLPPEIGIWWTVFGCLRKNRRKASDGHVATCVHITISPPFTVCCICMSVKPFLRFSHSAHRFVNRAVAEPSQPFSCCGMVSVCLSGDDSLLDMFSDQIVSNRVVCRRAALNQTIRQLPIYIYIYIVGCWREWVKAPYNTTHPRITHNDQICYNHSKHLKRISNTQTIKIVYVFMAKRFDICE